MQWNKLKSCPRGDLDMLKLNLRSKAFESFTQTSKWRKTTSRFFFLNPFVGLFIFFFIVYFSFFPLSTVTGTAERPTKLPGIVSWGKNRLPRIVMCKSPPGLPAVAALSGCSPLSLGHPVGVGIPRTAYRPYSEILFVRTAKNVFRINKVIIRNSLLHC